MLYLLFHNLQATARLLPALPCGSQSAVRGPERATRSNSDRRYRLNCSNAKIRNLHGGLWEWRAQPRRQAVAWLSRFTSM
eukprot:365409-Chlamydomonas_euryale.AAC.4